MRLNVLNGNGARQRLDEQATPMYARTAEPAMLSTEVKLNVENLDVYYGQFHAIGTHRSPCPSIA